MLGVRNVFFVASLCLLAPMVSCTWRWEGKVAVVTGASSGIGAATALALAEKGVKVIGLARRDNKIKELATKTNGTILAVRCDLTKERDILRAFKWVEDNHGGVDILVNNAGLVKWSPLNNGSTADWKNILDVNVLGLSICTREALKTMRKRGDEGYIININSIVGHMIPQHTIRSSSGYYPASKYAVTALTEVLRLELVALKSNIKVTSLSPGYVRTDIINTLTEEVKEHFAHFKDIPFLEPEDIAESIIYILSTNLNVQIKELTIQPVGQTEC